MWIGLRIVSRSLKHLSPFSWYIPPPLVGMPLRPGLVLHLGPAPVLLVRSSGFAHWSSYVDAPSPAKLVGPSGRALWMKPGSRRHSSLPQAPPPRSLCVPQALPSSGSRVRGPHGCWETRGSWTAVASRHGAVEEEEATETPNWGFPGPRQRFGGRRVRDPGGG